MSGTIHDSMSDLIGATPLVHLRRLSKGPGEIVAKLESLNPMSSVKDRIGLAMIQAAEKDGRLSPGGEIIEAVSNETRRNIAVTASALIGLTAYLLIRRIT